MPKSFPDILEFDEVDRQDLAKVGGKGANLGEMTQAGFPVPSGFIIQSSAYFEFLEENDFKKQIKHILSSTNKDRPKELQHASEQIRSLLEKGKIPDEIAKEILDRYKKIGSLFSSSLVAVRSSATAEDLPDASFAGQQESFLNIKGDATLLVRVRECWSSLFTPRAIFYREEKKYSHFEVGIAVVIQEMVQSEVSGVAFTSDPHGIDKHRMIIESVWGLGESIVLGEVTPDHYDIERHSLEILSKTISPQEYMLVKNGSANKQTKVQKSKIKRQKLTDQEIRELGKILQKVHNHYFFPQDIEWAKKHGKFYIIQSRPITTLNSDMPEKSLDEQNENNSIHVNEIILQGQGASPGLVTGHVRIVKNAKEIKKVKKGEILVTTMTSPDFVPAMKLAAAIVTDRGGITSHAAIVSRELGIACIVGTERATKILKDGDVITVNGKEGTVTKGTKKVEKVVKVDGVDIKPREDLKTATKIYVNLGEPERVNELAKLPIDGVGLLRAEFMIAEIGVHPRHLISQGRQKVFVEKLSQGLETFCEAFEDRPVVYRTTDFKTNEYRNLTGGRDFEPQEPNPMLGFRGAYRYIADPEVFELELAAIRKVRDKHKNLWVMIPYVRTPQELLEVKRIMAASGLVRSPSFKIWMMIELPVNVILIDDFLKIGIDGISFGSNDLTMLIMGTDRDNNEVAGAFNELNPAVLWSLKRVIKACHKFGVTSSICGQAVSSYDSLVEDLVKFGITSVSVNPDAIGRVQKVIHEAERRIGS